MLEQNSKSIPKKNGKVELLRFIFALCILIFHINKRFYGTNGIHTGIIYYFSRGCFGVEFFFLVSGYLIGKKAYDMRMNENMNLGSETYRVIRKKVISVFPMAFLATAITVLVNMFVLHDNMYDRFIYLFDSWPSFFLLNLFGFYTTWGNKLTWYLSAYLMSTAILYPLARRYYNMFTYIACPLGALFILGWMDHTYGYLSGSTIWTGYFYLSFLRGLSEMALGIFAFHLTRYLNKQNLSDTTRKIFTIAEPLGYLIIFFFINTKYVKHAEFPMLFLTMLIMILSFSEINPMRETFNRPFIYWLGKISLPLYLNQFYVIRLSMALMRGLHNDVIKITIIIINCMICAIVSDKLISWIMGRSKEKNK